MSTIVLQVNTHRQTESDFHDTTSYFHRGHDDISRRKVLPPGVYTRTVCPAQYVLVPDIWYIRTCSA